jgi:hypothetical protein
VTVGKIVATVGSMFDRMMEGIAESERHRERADRIAKRVKDTARTEFLARRSSVTRSSAAMEAVAQARADADPLVKAAIDGEQWGQRLTTMYGIAHLTIQMDEMLVEQRRANELQKETNALLRVIGRALVQSLKTTEPDIVIPAQQDK